ncbi:unnamed protein product [Bursaphelenchus okinawaensis]|uniref:Uncharacterized protein n=1 Tax=Bursaphelenchus okinawaensis TaxID=465554 RepID=A0A811JW67_9BILA|nr:unnamed protein product [Bursaphelenchus okinawaensis]CAG9085780.1 unnamed protein product [Bursaphelenchus okinawaensis]
MQTRSAGLLLIGYSAYTYVTDQYWLLSGLLPLISGLLLTFKQPEKHSWRFLTMLCIVIGTMITLFYTHLSLKYQETFAQDSDSLKNLTHDTLGTALTVCLTTSGFYSTRKGKISYVRLFLLAVIIAAMAFSAINASCNHFSELPYCQFVKIY